MAKYDRLIDIAARVKALREELKQAEAELERVVSGDDDAARAVARPGSVADRVLNVLLKEPMREYGVEELSVAVGEVTPSTLRSTVARLAREGVIDKRQRGKYRAKFVDPKPVPVPVRANGAASHQAAGTSAPELTTA